MNPRSSSLPPELLIGQADFVGALSHGLLADPGAADDVAQDALLAALQRPPSAAASLRAWLTRVVRNRASERGRAEARRSAREQLAARPEGVPSTADVLARESARAAVVRAVLELEEPYRAAILLRYYENHAPREIARLLDLPIDTVHTRTKRALALLRARLDHEFGARSAWAALLLPFTRLAPAPCGPGAAPSSLPTGEPAMSLALKLAAAGLVLAAGSTYVLRAVSDGRGTAEPTGEQGSAAPAAVSAAAGTGPSARQPLDAPSLARAQAGMGAAATAQSAEPSAPAPLAFSSGSLRLVLTWSDGTPAEGVYANVLDVGRDSHEPLGARSDAQGQCLLAGLRAGKAWVTLDRSEGFDTAQIEAGEESVLALQIARGFDVEGLVVAADGLPVAGATVWCGDIGSGPDSSFPLATSAADGRFRLRSLQRLGGLWARADGHAPSLLLTLEEPEGTSVSVTLALTGPGASVAGRVLDPDGAPVEGALVLVDGQDMLRAFPLTMPDGRATHGSRPGPLGLRTDGEGRFAAAGLRPGTVPLGVLARGHAAWRGSVEAAAGELGERTITLAPGFRLSGTVRASNGQPVSGRVWVYHAALSDQLSPTVLTGPDGAFEFEALAPGEVRVVVDGRDGEAWTTLTGQAGDELSWDALLGQVILPEDWVIETAPWGW